MLLILGNNHKISANSIHRKYDYLPQSLTFDDDRSNILLRRDVLSFDDEITSPDLWARIIRPRYISTAPNFNLRQGIIGIIPYKKRTIPLELQKALYAHGIVGRRR